MLKDSAQAGVSRLETKLEAQSWKPLKSSGPSVNILKLLLGSVGSTLKRTKKERTLVQKPFTNDPCPGEWVIRFFIVNFQWPCCSSLRVSSLQNFLNHHFMYIH